MKPTAFDPKELNVIGSEPTFMGGSVPVYDTPISLKEGAIAANIAFVSGMRALRKGLRFSSSAAKAKSLAAGVCLGGVLE